MAQTRKDQTEQRTFNSPKCLWCHSNTIETRLPGHSSRVFPKPAGLDITICRPTFPPTWPLHLVLPVDPLAKTSTSAFQERLWDTAAQRVTASPTKVAEKVFKAAKVLVPKGYVPITLFVEHYTILMATLLPDQHDVSKELFETLEELEQNKRHINAKAGDDIKFASQFICSIQIQMNKYARSVERGRRVKYPTFSTIVSALLTNQFLSPPLPAKIKQQLVIRTPRRGGAC